MATAEGASRRGRIRRTGTSEEERMRRPAPTACVRQDAMCHRAILNGLGGWDCLDAGKKRVKRFTQEDAGSAKSDVGWTALDSSCRP